MNLVFNFVLGIYFVHVTKFFPPPPPVYLEAQSLLREVKRVLNLINFAILTQSPHLYSKCVRHWLSSIRESKRKPPKKNGFAND